MDKNLQLFKLQRGSTDTGLQIIKCHISQAGSPADGFQNKINHMRQNVSGTYFKRADEVAEKNPFHSVNSFNYKFEGTQITTRLEKEHSTTKGNKGKKKKKIKAKIHHSFPCIILH
jgi:hypothetical protein